MMAVMRAVLLAGIFVLSGCASPKAYFLDRGRDAMDIFTLTGGTGLGAKAQCGPIHAGLFGEHDAAGLRGGELFVSQGADLWEYLGPDPGDLDATVIAVQFSPLGTDRGKDYYAISSSHPKKGRPNFLPFIVLPDTEGDTASFYAFFTQIEVGAGVVVAVRAGFNPGELVDFVLGWFTVDIYGDDIGVKPPL